MPEVATHYEKLLAQHYTWMLGPDFDGLVAEQRQVLDSCGAGSATARNDVALDLGCGSGVHSIALAQLGYGTVVAVDISRTLLAELAARSARFPAIRPVHADMCDGLDGVVGRRSVTAAVCMGDTLPHLPDTTAVRRLVDDVFGVLVPGGTFTLSFRDLSTRLTGLDRFIQVRADEDRILTCFLEDDGDRVRVHDLVHSKAPDGTWRLDTSSYRKLRLSPTWVTGQLREAGFVVTHHAPGPRGMCLITARRPEQAAPHAGR